MFFVHYPPFPFGEPHSEEIDPMPVEEEEEVTDWLPVRIIKTAAASVLAAMYTEFLSVMYSRGAQNSEWWK